MTDATTERTVRARAAGVLRGFWYGFVRLFGLGSCPIDQGPGAARPPRAGPLNATASRSRPSGGSTRRRPS
jgi:hypothetical protein